MPDLREVLGASAGAVRRTSPAAALPHAPAPPAPAAVDPSPDAAPRALAPVELEVDRGLPPGTATLAVQMHGDDEFTVIARSAPDLAVADPPRRTHRRPDIALADIARVGGVDPEEVLDLMDAWSVGSAELADWLGALAAARADVALLVLDDSGFEIPWELVSLGPGPAAYAGARLCVTRHQLRAPRGGAAPEPAAGAGGPGAVIAYLDDELGAIEHDVQSLAALDVERCDSVEAFEARLRAGAEGYALVYLACHGVFADSILDTALGPRGEGASRLVLGRLYRRGLPVACPVFINACHSARFVEDRRLRDALLRGFPDLFLRQGAPGVVGTMGEVSDALAARLARELLQDALAHPERPLPRLLRDRRAAVAAAHAAGAVSTEDLVCAFMYVFFGDPGCRVRLARA